MNESYSNLNLEHTPFAFLDVETTGLEPQRGHRVCEIAVVRTVGRVETRRFSSLINPGRRIGAGAQAVNRISDYMVANAPRFRDLMDEVLALLDGAVIVAHNAPFDLGFVNHELHLAWQAPLQNPVVDTLAIARKAYRFPSNSLDALTRRLGLLHPQQHRALGDALAVKHLMWWMADNLQARGVRTVGDLLEIQRGRQPGTPMEAHIPADLQEAIGQGCSMVLRYQSRDGFVTNRRVDPIRIDERRGTQYLVAYCHLRQAERSFRIDRILEIKIDDSD
ncbi:MAG: WYL domain-containing protein [Chloroflexi bacterium]|nr:MAG: WYL domain-containing protein [Chloroflexota bacterium]